MYNFPNITRKKLIRNWPLELLLVLIFILLLQKYILQLFPSFHQIQEKPQITLYSNPTYYNAVLPWLAFNQKQRKFHLNHKIWFNITGLQFQIRHEQGELWITSLEGATQAWLHHADLKILMVMGWKKWNLISSLNEEEFLQQREKVIYYPLYNNSARNVLKEVFRNTDETIEYRAVDLSKLLDRVISGQIQTALLQTPLCAFVQMKKPSIQTNIPIEQIYLEQQGKITRFPWIVLAVRGKWARENPELVAFIQHSLRKESYILNLMPIQDISKIWENTYESDIPGNILEKLLKYEKLLSLPAVEAEEQIKLLLKLAMPHVTYSPDMLWRPAAPAKEK